MAAAALSPPLSIYISVCHRLIVCCCFFLLPLSHSLPPTTTKRANEAAIPPFIAMCEKNTVSSSELGHLLANAKAIQQDFHFKMIKVLQLLLFTSSLLLVSNAQKTCSAETESVDVTQVHLPEAKVWRGRALPLTLSPYVKHSHISSIKLKFIPYI